MLTVGAHVREKSLGSAGGHIAQVAILYRWPYCASGRTPRAKNSFGGGALADDMAASHSTIALFVLRCLLTAAGGMVLLGGHNTAMLLVFALLQEMWPLCATWPPIQYGHLRNKATCAI